MICTKLCGLLFWATLYTYSLNIHNMHTKRASARTVCDYRTILVSCL